MKIGELARWARCQTVTIRYYEKMGLLSGTRRDANGHRIYDENDVERLRFILHCRNHGISLSDIRTLLKMRSEPGQTGGEAVLIIRKQIENLKRQRMSLDELIRSLSGLLDENGDASDGRSIIDVLGRPCPYCPDYQEKLHKGMKLDSRSSLLAHPSGRIKSKIS